MLDFSISFNASNTVSTRASERERERERQMSIPHLFRCPISLDIFTDPVTLCTGQTYDRIGIEKWLAAGNFTCPVTMQRLHDTSLVPNHTLKHLIDQWLLPDPATANSIHPKPLTAAAIDADVSSSTADYSLATIKKDLQSASTTSASKLEALKKLRTLSLESDIARARLIQLGFFQLLLHLLFRWQPAFNTELVEVALDCVLSLSSSIDGDALNMLEEKPVFDKLLQMLEQSNPNIKTSLCYLLEAMATASGPQELSSMLGQSQRVWRALLSMLQNSSDARAPEAAAQVIAGICKSEANQTCAVSNGAVDGLVLYLSNSRRKNASRALGTLEILVGLDAGNSALMKTPNAIQVLVKMVFRMSSNQEGSEHAVGALLVACRDSAWMRLEAVNAGVLTQLLLLLQSQCSSRAKSKARALLKLLRSIWTEEQQPKV